MQRIYSSQYHKTSITVRESSRRRLKAAVLYAKRHGIDWSESEILQRLATLYLQAWRGRGKKSATTRRYNCEIGGHRYVRVPWYVSKVLYSALWARGIHTGESISRMLDFAIRHYMLRLMESALSNPYSSHPCARRDFAYWRAKFERRLPRRPEPFITYTCATQVNTVGGLKYEQETRIFSESELFAPDYNPASPRSA